MSSSSGFNPGGGGSSEYYPGRPISNINNLITTTPSLSINHLNHPSLYRTQHHHQQHQQQQQLPPIFIDPCSQIPQHRIVGKRTLAEFQTQQNQTYNHNHNLNLNNNNNHLNNMNNNNHNHALSNLLLRSVKPRNGFQFHNNNPVSFSVPELQNPSSFNNNFQTPRLGVPLLHQLRPQPQPYHQPHHQPINPNFQYRNSNLAQVVNRVQILEPEKFEPVNQNQILEPEKFEPINQNQILEPEKIEPVNQNQILEPVNQNQILEPGKIEPVNQNQILEPEKKINKNPFQELEKRLYEDDDECVEGDASVITNEWTETYQNLLSGPGGPDGLPCGPIPAPAPAQKPSSSSPTTSTTSSTSTAASSHASICSRQTLIDAASAISEGKNDVALEILTQRLVLNPNGNSDQRLTNCMLSALKLRMNPCETHFHVAELFGREHAESTQLFLENSVCFKVSYMAANLAILESAFEENGRGFCVVDFEIGQGKQYVNLLHVLKARDIALPPGFTVKLTAVADNAGDEMVKAVGEMLVHQAERLRIAFEFRLVSVSRITELSRELLGCGSEETLVVNFAFKLNRIPDESVSTENPRDELLRRVKKLSPRVVTVVEQEMNCNTAPFLARVAESWSYYSALYDSVETVLGKDSLERVKIEEGLSRKIKNSVACEGRDRVERFEVFGKWRARMSMAGFMLKPMSQNVAELIKSRISGGNNSRVNTGLTVKEENGGICFGWMGRTLTVASAWR